MKRLDNRAAVGNNIKLWLPILFSLALILLCCRAPYGYFFDDEPYIITLAQRVYYGDRLILDEWHVAQPIAPLLLPLYSLYVNLTGGTEGILLAFRFTYCLMWTMVCYMVCKTLIRETKPLNAGKYGAVSVIWATLYLFLFSPLDYMTLSYTSIGLSAAFAVICLALWNTPELKLRPPTAGILLAVSVCIQVLCSPYMCFPVIAGTVVAWVYLKRGKKNGPEAMIRCLFWFAGSVLVIFLLFCLLFILRGKEVAYLIPCIRAIFHDPQHPARGLLKGLLTMIINLGKKCAPFAVIISAAALVVLLKPKWASRFRLHVFLLCCLGYLFAMFQCITWWRQGLNYQMIDLAMLGFISYLLLHEKPKRLFCTFYLYGLAYTVCNYFGSNTELFSVGMTLSVCGTAGAVFVMLLCHELSGEYKTKPVASEVIGVLAAVLVLAQLGAQGYLKVTRQYWDRPLSQLTARIDVGAAKGIMTTEGRKNQYEENYRNLRGLLQNASVGPDSRFVSLSPNTIAYLDARLPVGTYSSWTFTNNDPDLFFARMDDYIRLGHAPPDVLYCAKRVAVPDRFQEEGYEVYTNGEAVLYKRSR